MPRRVMAQVAMVMNLDKCIGCHTCSVTCKQAWTNRAGTEYVWFNNVETRPGQGYPRRHEDQETWRGGWVRTKSGGLKLRAGGRFAKLLSIFASPVQPELGDYYEPWTYDYQNLISAPLGDDFPVARPKSLITGEDTKITWSANWDDSLGGSQASLAQDPILEKLRAQANEQLRQEYEKSFMFFLPRICEHCLNPSCMASCPSGAIYKRAEDGIVLVDQDRCRGWRMCVTGCPYKKVYFNHRTGKAEKCTFCYPRVEVVEERRQPLGRLAVAEPGDRLAEHRAGLVQPLVRVAERHRGHLVGDRDAPVAVGPAHDSPSPVPPEARFGGNRPSGRPLPSQLSRLTRPRRSSRPVARAPEVVRSLSAWKVSTATGATRPDASPNGPPIPGPPA